MSVPIIIIILVFVVCLIALCVKSPEKPAKRRDPVSPASYTSTLENGSNSYFVLIEIKPFLDTYIEGASIPEDLFIELQRKSLNGQKYAEIPRHVLDRVKTRLRNHQKKNEALCIKSKEVAGHE